MANNEIIGKSTHLPAGFAYDVDDYFYNHRPAKQESKNTWLVIVERVKGFIGRVLGLEISNAA